MARVGETIENPVTSERITWIETAQTTGGELLSFDLYLRPGAAVAAEHRHVRQEERFRVHAGAIALEVAAERRDVGLWEEVAVPAGVPHRWWNEGQVEAVVRVELSGPRRFLSNADQASCSRPKRRVRVACPFSRFRGLQAIYVEHLTTNLCWVSLGHLNPPLQPKDSRNLTPSKRGRSKCPRKRVKAIRVGRAATVLVAFAARKRGFGTGWRLLGSRGRRLARGSSTSSPASGGGSRAVTTGSLEPHIHPE